MFSQVCVSLYTVIAHMTITHDASDLTVQGHYPRPPAPTAVLGPIPSSNIWCHWRPFQTCSFGNLMGGHLVEAIETKARTASKCTSYLFSFSFRTEKKWPK